MRKLRMGTLSICVYKTEFGKEVQCLYIIFVDSHNNKNAQTHSTVHNKHLNAEILNLRSWDAHCTQFHENRAEHDIYNSCFISRRMNHHPYINL